MLNPLYYRALGGSTFLFLDFCKNKIFDLQQKLKGLFRFIKRRFIPNKSVLVIVDEVGYTAIERSAIFCSEKIGDKGEIPYHSSDFIP